MANHGDTVPEDMKDASDFVELLRRLKERSGLTYRQLEERAAECGEVLPRSTLAEVLNGRRLPRPEVLTAFVRACGDGDRTEEWLRRYCETAGRLVAADGQVGTRLRSPGARRPRRTVVFAAVAAALAAAAAVLLTSASAPGDTAEGRHAAVPSEPPALRSAPADGWVYIRPVTAPELCLADGRVLDGRYTPLVAVQRPCDETAPMNTLLEPMGKDLYRIQWHHPDYGKGCLKILTKGAGAGLLEPQDDCGEGDSFHVEPSGPYGEGRFVLRADGQGCVGIKDSRTARGVEAVMERCVGKGGQVFLIEPAS